MHKSEHTNPLVTADWLHEHLDDERVVIIDVSPASTVQGKSAPFQNLVIPGAIVLDIKNELTDPSSPFPNTVPSRESFEHLCTSIGIQQDSIVVVYDNLGIYTSPRAWWLFKIMNHSNVKVLDGGLPNWVEQGYKTTSKAERTLDHKKENYRSKLREKAIVSYDQIVDNIESQDFIVVDARSKVRFDGEAPEPRKNLKSGCIPNSKNLSFTLVLDGYFMKPKEQLQEIFKPILSVNKPLVFSCGSGITACILLLAFHIIGGTTLSVFDGSWTEFATRQGLLVS